MSFFKKKENEFSTGKKKPKLKPVGGDAKEKAGTSGKGGGQPAEPKYDVNAKGWNDQVAKFNAKGGINNDGKFGYGYVDTQTGIEVPWYIDMINGGGANAAGDTFVSPFEGTPMGLPAQAVTGGLNALNVAPYGYNRPRYFMPMEAARVDAEGKPVQVDLGAATRPTGVGSPTVTPVVDNSQNGDAGEYRSMDQAVGGYQYPSMYRPMDRQVGLLQQAQSSPQPSVYETLVDTAAQSRDIKRSRNDVASTMDRYMPASMNMGQTERMPQRNLPNPATFTATPPSMAAMTPPSQPSQALVDFNQAMSTVPQMLQGTQIEQMYRDYLLAGNRGTFAQFTGAQ